MKRRLQSLDEFINESVLNESISAKEVAKKLGVDDASDKEVSLWVTISNQFDEYGLDIFQELSLAKSIAGANEKVAIAIYAEYNGNNVIMFIKRAAATDMKDFINKATKTTPDKWESLGATINVEKVTYTYKKLDVREVTEKTDKSLRRFVEIMK